jgi:hypothetical protein
VKIEGIHSKLSLWLHTNDSHLVDAVSLVVGMLTPEQKACHSKDFVNSHACWDFLSPATSGAANAGIESAQVFGVFRVDFPPARADMKQEGGRAGRRPEGTTVKDFYCVMISLKGFLHLHLCIMNSNELVHDSTHW